MSTLGYLPERITAGATIWIAAANTTGDTNADIVIPSYLPASYSLSYQFAAATPITVAAVANGGGTGWTLEVTAAQTLLWKAGTCRFAGFATATSGGRVFLVDSGTIAVDPSPLSTSAWASVVAACDAAILAGATSGQLSSFGLGDMNITYRSPKDLMDLRAYAQTMAEQETGARMKRIIRARFP